MKVLVRYSRTLCWLGILTVMLPGGLKSAEKRSGVVIVNVFNTVDSLDQTDLRRIYLGQRLHWEGNQHVTPVDLKRGAEIREHWLDEVIQLTDKQYKRVWLRNAFSGHATPPRSFATDAEVIEFVTDNPGGIGYIAKPSEDLPAGVKAIAVEGAKSFNSKKTNKK